jgi:hypothetical protein
MSKMSNRSHDKPGRGAPSRRRRWDCSCTSQLAEHWLTTMAEAALLGETDAALIPEVVEHYLVTVRREQVRS